MTNHKDPTPARSDQSTSDQSTLWILIFLASAFLCGLLAIATISMGAVVMIGTSGIPGPGFFIFGGLAILSALLCVALLIYRLFRWILNN